VRTIKAKQLFDAIVRMEGRDPATADLSDAQKAVRAELANDRIKEGWEYALWPETLIVETRRYRETWGTTRNYVTGDEVYLNDVYYRSLQDGNVGHSPDETDSAWWVETTTFLRSIELAQYGATVISGIDTENGVFAVDPRIYRDAKALRPVRIVGDALYIESPDKIALPYIRFRPAAPEISWTAWNGMTAYAIGDLVYLAATGEAYKALEPSTNVSPYEHPVQWEAVGVPAFLATYVKHAVAADLLQEDQGKYKEQARAEAELERLHDVLIEQQGAAPRARFR
jgi:hypothetical protein